MDQVNLERNYKQWTNDENSQLESLLENNNFTIREISIFLQRTINSIRFRIKKLNLKFKKDIMECSSNKWTFNEENQLIKLYGSNKLNIKNIAQIHKRSECAIKYRLNKLMLFNKKRVIKRENSYKKWTLYEENQLIDQYFHKHIDLFDVATNLKRTKKAIMLRLKKVKKYNNSIQFNIIH